MAQVSSSTGGFDLNLPFSENFLKTNPGTPTAFSGTTVSGLLVSFTGSNFSYFTRDDGLQALVGGIIDSITIVQPNQASLLVSGLGLSVDQYKILVAQGSFYSQLFGGDDVLAGSDSSDTLAGSAGDDTLIGNGGNDFLYGNIGEDSIMGGQGNDILFGGQNDDFVNGGSGNNAVYGNLGNDIVIADDGDDTLYGGQGADRIYGNLGHDILFGNKGDDKLYGYNGDDTLIGGDGNDFLHGGTGLNTYIIGYGGGEDTISLTDGEVYDVQFYTGFNATLVNSITKRIVFSDGSGINFGVVRHPSSLKGSIGNDTFVFESGSFSKGFYAGEGDDYIKGDTSSDFLSGEAGNDLIYGRSSSDTLDGGQGNDTLYGGASNFAYDLLVGGEGDDILWGGAGLGDDSHRDSYQFGAKTGNDTIMDFGEDDELIFTEVTVTSQTKIDGGFTLSLSDGGSVTVFGPQINLNISGNGDIGFDTLRSASKGMNLTGRAGDDLIYGDSGSNNIFGGNNNTTPIQSGFSDNDTLYGASGNDDFIFYGGVGHDIIMDFSAGDRIYIYNGSLSLTTITDTSIITGGVRLTLSHGEIIDVIGGTSQNMTGKVYVNGDLYAGDFL